MSIVVGFVPTPEGNAALERAAKEAKLHQTDLVVVESHRGGASYGAEDAASSDRELGKVREFLDGVGIDYTIRTLIRGNDPTADLIAAAEDANARFIVIGLRRRTSVGKLILGSNAQEILLNAECPVLAVKAPRN